MTKTKSQKARAKAAKGQQLNKAAGKAKRKPRNRQRQGTRQPGPRDGFGGGTGVISTNMAPSVSQTSTYFRMRAGNYPNSIIVEGRDLLRVAQSAASAAGTFVNTFTQVSVDINTPMCTRWGTWGSLFQKWRVNKLEAFMKSSGILTTVGNVFAAFQHDEQETAPTTAELTMRLEGSVMTNGYGDLGPICFDPASQIKWLDCQADTALETSSPGALNVSTTNYASALVPGIVFVDYELEFIDVK